MELLKLSLAVVVSLLLPQAAVSQDKPVDDRMTSQILAMCREDTAEYTLAFANDPAAKFESKEVMKWTNPVREGQTGTVAIWLKNGRAQALSSVFVNPASKSRITVMHEFQSLATQPIVSRRKDEIKWSPKSAGVTFRSVPDAPEPADSPAARLRQMRSLIRDFSAHSLSVYGTPTRWELRMLPQPLYRYTEAGREALDGALFTFVSTAGTDPELLLLIEARKSGDRWDWQYAPARFSDHSLWLLWREKDVWSFLNEERNSRFAAGMTDSYRLFDDRLISDASLKEGAQ